MNKGELEIFYENANQEELLKHEVELMSFGNISSANLSTCEAYGLSGNCGSKCPKFKDKTCEVYVDVLEKENTNLKQALNKIRKLANDNLVPESRIGPFARTDTHRKNKLVSDILQIIKEAIGDDENGR